MRVQSGSHKSYMKTILTENVDDEATKQNKTEQSNIKLALEKYKLK